MSLTEPIGGYLPDYYTDDVKAHRQPEHPIHPLILNRWSPRAYRTDGVPERDLHTVLEAACWAPSSGNQQPWRFYVAVAEAEHETFRSFILPGNRAWTDQAPVLILIASETRRENGDPNGSHAFDAGAAWGFLSVQAALLGLSTRAVGGFDRARARQELRVPEGIELHAVIALGYRGQPENLPDPLREKEKPTGRRPIRDSLVPVPTAAE